MDENLLKRQIIAISVDFYSAFSLIKQIAPCAWYGKTELAIQSKALDDLKNVKYGLDTLVSSIKVDNELFNQKLSPAAASMEECLTNITQVVAEMNTDPQITELRKKREVKLTAFYDQFTCLLPIMTQMNDYNNKKMIQVVNILEKILAKLEPQTPDHTPAP
jgi:hypothetical protein